MDRDFTTKGAELIKTKFGIVSATKENFNLSPAEMMENKQWQEAVGLEGGVFCLAPWELDIPF